MFRLILLTAQEIERTGDWIITAELFRFLDRALGGWLPRFDRCAICAATFGTRPAYFATWEPGLLCDKCRRPGMFGDAFRGRELAERFAGERLDRIVLDESMKPAMRELREASLGWIEHHTERKLRRRWSLK